MPMGPVPPAHILAPRRLGPGLLDAAPGVHSHTSFAAAIKTADQTHTSNTTLANDTHLTATVEASTVYIFWFTIFYSQDAGGADDLKLAVTCPAGGTLRWGASGAQPSSTDPQVTSVTLRYVSASGTGEQYGTSATGAHTLLGSGTLENGATAGSLTIQHAQWASSANVLRIRQGSNLLVFPVG